MSRITRRFLRGSGSMPLVSTSGWKTRLKNLEWLDWVVIVILVVGVWVAIYTASLRHP